MDQAFHLLPRRSFARLRCSSRTFATHVTENGYDIRSVQELIVTWNFSHINNPFTKMMIRQTVENAGYECPEIVPPDAFLGDEP